MIKHQNVTLKNKKRKVLVRLILLPYKKVKIWAKIGFP